MPSGRGVKRHSACCPPHFRASSCVVGEPPHSLGAVGYGRRRSSSNFALRETFDARCDRLFGVGDLVDRGPHRNEAVDWLEHRFEAVAIGNQDRTALGRFEAKLNGSRAAGEDWKQTLARDEYPRWQEVAEGLQQL